MVDLVLEVRDARIPFSTCHPQVLQAQIADLITGAIVVSAHSIYESSSRKKHYQ